MTPEEEAENHKFLDSIVKTPSMKVIHGLTGAGGQNRELFVIFC